MFESKAYAIQMSFDVPRSEKRVAEKAEECFQHFNRKLKKALNHLSLIYDPFKNLQDIDNKQLVDKRHIFRRYKNQVKKNFEDVVKDAYKVVTLMSEFSSDTKTQELMNSFTDSIEDLQKQVRNFLSIFSNLNNKSFHSELVASIDSVRKKANQVRQLVNDRILEHIDSNILAKDWMASISDKYQYKVDEKLPLVMELFKERQKALDEQEG
jgi:hypothetical protein